MWLSAIKLAAQAGSHIYKNRQKTKNAYGRRPDETC